MKTTRAVAVAGTLALAATALTAGPASAATENGRHDDHHRDSSVFVQTDNTGGNTVVAYDRAADGTLHQDGVYATGGLGGVLTGSVVDHLASQGSLTLDRAHDLLYAMNAGSNTVTVFGVDGDHLKRLQVVRSGGAFPVSVAVHGNLVYVLNARDGGSVQGFLRIGKSLIRVPGWHRDLGLDPTLTPEFTHTPGQVAFSPDGSKLVVTTKAGGQSIDVFDVGRFGGLAAEPVVNDEAGTVPFAVTFDARGHLIAAQAGTNAISTFRLGNDGTLEPISSALTGQAATCWIVRSGSHLYVSNAGSASVSGYEEPGNGQLRPLGNTTTDAGTVDAAASSDGRYLYVQAGAAGIVDEFRIGHDGALTSIGSVTVPGAVGGEGIATS